MNCFRKNLLFLRKKYGYTQEKLANILDFSRSKISSYEDGRAEPDIDTIVKISNVFKVSIDEMLKYDLAKQKNLLMEMKQGLVLEFQRKGNRLLEDCMETFYARLQVIEKDIITKNEKTNT